MVTVRKTILLAHDTHPLQYLFADAIQHWIDNSDHPYQPATHSYPPHLHDPIRHAINSQARIGWSHLLTGLFSTEWSILVRLDMQEATTKPDTAKGANRICKCLAGIHTFTHQLLLARNSVLHADTEAATIATVRTAEQIKVRYYHQRPPIRQETPLRSQPSTAPDWISHNSQTTATTRQILCTNTHPRRHATVNDTNHLPNSTVIGECRSL